MVIALWAAVVALLLFAAALALWQYAAVRERRAGAAQFIEARLAQSQAPIDDEVPAYAGGERRLLGSASWRAFLLRAGMRSEIGFYLGLLLPLLVAVVLAALFGGLIAALAAAVLSLLVQGFRLWLAASRRQQRMAEQLPGFLDALVRLLTIGNSLGSAFQVASANATVPLAEVLERAASLNRSGMELDKAMLAVARLYRLHELYLVAAVVGLAMRYGGRSDQVLERMAAFMRDLQQARQELVALSAEVRLSAWVLALLPVGLAGFILIFNNALFMGMWHDSVGRIMLAGAVVLQVTGTFWLYRLAKSV